MGKSISQLRQSLGDWLHIVDADDPQLPASVRDDCVNIAQRKACRFDLSFNEFSDTFPTVASTRSYSKPATLSRPHTFWYKHTVTGQFVYLDYLTKEEFDLRFPDATKLDYPCAYTIWGSSIQLAPTPGSIVTINRNYYGALADLSDLNPTNALTDGAWEYLLFQGLVEASAFGIEDDRIPMWASKAERLLADIVADHARAHSTGRKSQNREPG